MQQYHIVLGFGLKITPGMFDVEKSLEFIGEEVELMDSPEEEFEQDFDAFVFDIADRSSNISGLKTFVDKGRYYLYYPAKLPWEMNDTFKDLTLQTATDNIVVLLKPYLKEGVDLTELRSNIGFIADCVPVID